LAQLEPSQQLALANLAAMAAQQLDKLHPNGIAQRAGQNRHLPQPGAIEVANQRVGALLPRRRHV
jgi:hypothetical protein